MRNRYGTERAKKVYGLSDSESEVAQIAYETKNTKTEEAALVLLECLINERQGDTAVLYDLAADFNWDYKPDQHLAAFSASK